MTGIFLNFKFPLKKLSQPSNCQALYNLRKQKVYLELDVFLTVHHELTIY